MTAPITRETADHAELAADLLRVEYEESEWPLVLFCGRLVHIDNVLKYAADGLTALLSEIAALRVREAALIDGKTDMFRRATQAERQRDEAVGLLRELADGRSQKNNINEYDDLSVRASSLLANQGADHAD